MYTLIPPPKLKYGQAAQIALCHEFADVAAAKAGGCDAVLLINAETVAWAYLLTVCERTDVAIVLGDLIAAVLSQRGLRASLDVANVEICNKTPLASAMIHTDIYTDDPRVHDTVALLSTPPGTELYWQRPVRCGDPRDDGMFFQRRNGLVDVMEVTLSLRRRLEKLKPEFGAMVFLFETCDGETLAHSAPPHRKQRARLIWDVSLGIK